MDAESCSDVTEVDPASLSGLGIQAAALSNSTLTVLNLTGNSVHDVQDLQLPEDLEQLYLSKNELTSLKVPESWRHLELLDVSSNPIANFSSESKDGPKILVARNTSLLTMENAVFPDTLRQLDVSFTTIEKWANFTPPTDLSELIAQGSSIVTARACKFQRMRAVIYHGFFRKQYQHYSRGAVPTQPAHSVFEWKQCHRVRDSCSDGATQKAVLIVNASYSFCVLTDEAFDKEYKRGKISSSTSLTTLLVLFFSLASAIFVLLMLFIIKRKVIDERRTKAALAEKVKAEQAANESSSDDDDSDKMKMTSAILTDDVRSDPDFERYRIAQNDLQFVKQLSKGAGGVVHLAKWKSKNEQVAVKQVDP
ncbi:hypothetical protein KRP22_009914 [Phytophthora ramorum]|nr:hypothetical protein KRP22_10087 [Phytophthora ramorum]